jgi:hypothetical protein
MQLKVPEFLFRGDADKNNVRRLRHSIDHGQLQTNLISGGFGREMFERPLVDIIHKHVGIGWAKTHFLSFSESEEIALRYGFGVSTHSETDLVSEAIDDDEIWECALIVLDTKRLEIEQIESGLYRAKFKPTLKKFENHEFIEILLISVMSALDQHPDRHRFETSLQNAKKDLEWLILPQTPVVFENGVTEYSAILDGGCFSEIRKMKLLR